MFKLVLYDYLNNFKLNYLNKSFELSMFLFMVIYNIFNKMIIFDFIVIILPILIGSFITGLNKGKINTMLYLCPINSNDKKKYFTMKFVANFIITIAIFCILGVILLFKGRIDLKFFMFNLVNTMSFMIYRNLSTIGYEYSYDKLKWCDQIAITLIAMTMLNLVNSMSYSIGGSFFFTNKIAMIFLGIQIFISLCFLKKWNQIVEFMIDYESYNSYN